MYNQKFRFSWGAFMFTWIYGVFNKSWICFISFLPAIYNIFAETPLPGFVSTAIAFVIGFTAQKFSAKNSPDFGTEAWYLRQKRWDTAGIIWLLLSIIFTVLAFLLPGIGVLAILSLI